MVFRKTDAMEIPEGKIIEDSEDRDRCRGVVEAAKVL